MISQVSPRCLKALSVYGFVCMASAAGVAEATQSLP